MSQETEAAPAAVSAPIESPVAAAEAVAEQPKAAVESDEDGRFSLLVKKEKALLEKEKQIKESSKKLKDFDEISSLLKKEPTKALERLGLSYADLTDAILNSDNPENKTKQKLDELEQRLAEINSEKERQQLQAQQRAEAEAIDNFKGQIAETLKSDDFELTAAYGQDGVDIVMSIVEQYYERTGKIMDVTDAAKLAEDQLEKLFQTNFVNSKKVKRFMGIVEQKEQSKEPQAALRTLTNSHGTLVTPSEPKRQLTDWESKQRAAEKLRQLLNQEK